MNDATPPTHAPGLSEALWPRHPYLREAWAMLRIATRRRAGLRAWSRVYLVASFAHPCRPSRPHDRYRISHHFSEN